MNISPWIKAARLRTLPLSFSSIITGSAIALMYNKFDLIIFFLALITTLFLQILSNYANDYGDALSGKDKERVGEKRMVASGEISPKSMKIAIYIVSILALISGITLIIYSIENFYLVLIFLAIGFSAIWAAIKYTAGKNPYGYSGYGDVFVFIFFGLVGVIATTFLYTKSFELSSILPAISIGTLATAVLTLNNLRDIENDSKTKKNTTIVKMGFANGKKYFSILVMISIISIIGFAILNNFKNNQYIFTLSIILLANINKKVLDTNTSKEMDQFLKKVSLSTFLLATLFFISMLY